MYSRFSSNGEQVADWLQDIMNPLRTLKREVIAQRARARVDATTRQVVTRLQTEPGKPRYPIRWSSERQRKAFFASDGFGRGIPTRRSGKLRAGWQVSVEFNDDGGAIKLLNLVDYAPYVQGALAQPFHIDTGWVQPGEIADEFNLRVYEGVTDTWFEVAGLAEVGDVV